MREEKEHIESIRRDKFSVNANANAERESWSNPLTADLHNAVENLSAQLYAKDVHFLMELIQNAEDNEYPEGVEPSLEFIIISRDITGTGAPATLLVFNNEIGFSRKNMESLCSVGLSTKKGRRKEGFIGEKGIGFKSVFLVSKNPYVFSNGYRVRFSDKPDEGCGIGYIVPEWVEEKPTIGDLESVYGTGTGKRLLPATVIILPLRPEKIKGVKKQLSEVHPELLLFLNKIKRLSVRENAVEEEEGCSKEETLCSISISSRTNLASTENSGASWYVELFSHEEEDMKCQYYMWRQAFPVDPQSKVDGREGVDMWNISLAFPLGERLNRHSVQAGIYAFLPTTMVTNLPFIIHSDFILASSRETILLDNKWNLGILGRVGYAFVRAFHSYVSNNNYLTDQMSKMFRFVPIHESSFPVLNGVREDIKKLLQEKAILTCESYGVRDKTELCKPIAAVRLLPAFRKILNKAMEEGLSIEGASFDGWSILHSFLDSKDFDSVLGFLGARRADSYWYYSCIKNCDLAVNLSHDTYVDLICFMMDHAKSDAQFSKSSSCQIPTRQDVRLSKYFWQIPMRRQQCDHTSNRGMCINFNSKVWYTQDKELYAWLYRWSREFIFRTDPFFMPAETQIAFSAHRRGHEIADWLYKSKRLEYLDLTKFMELASKTDAKQAVHLACFLYFTHAENLIDEYKLCDICQENLPLVDSHGVVHVKRKRTLFPATLSNWGKLFAHGNPFRGEQYIEIGEKYAEERELNGHIVPKDSVMNFLIKYTNALDLPLLQPPDVYLPNLNAELTHEKAFLLLNWVNDLVRSNSSLPNRFASSVRCGRWVKTISGFDKPESCYLAEAGKRPIVFQMIQSLPGFSVIDEEYYDGKISSYGYALKQIGVTLATELCYTPIIQQFISLATTTKMSSKRILALLKLVKHLKKHKRLGGDLLALLNHKKWLVTSKGLHSPHGSCYIQSEKKAILELTDLPVVDEGFYGSSIADHESELMLLGVVVSIEQVFRQIPTRLRFPADASCISKEGALFVLMCVRKLGESEPRILEKIRNVPWMKTVVGFKLPHECILYDIQWGLLTDVEEMPLIEEAYYGDGIRSFVMELKVIGVAVDLNDAEKRITDVFKSMLSSPSSSLTCSKVAMLLSYVKTTRERMPHVIPSLVSCFSGIRFLKTRHGFKCPSDSILFDSKWGTICTYVDLPLIDDGFHGINIYSYRNELELLGAVVDFSEGPHFVTAGLQLPKEPPGFFSAEAALMLLHCIGLLMKQRSNDGTLPDILLAKVKDSKWLKTHIGYKSPNDCVLIPSSWQGLLRSLNGPFLDLEFYGPQIELYRDQLKAIGTTVEAHDVGLHVYTLLLSQHDNQVISRVLGFLEKNRWKPKGEGVNYEEMQLWLPDGHGSDGRWVPRNHCVLHDKDNLFSANNRPLHFLEKHYNKKMVRYFSFAFDIPQYPSIDAYISLWSSWETDGPEELSLQHCIAVWEYIVANWIQHSNTIKEKIKKVPCTGPTGNAIQLVNIDNSAVPDDLELTNLFRHNNREALFVWYPLEDSPTIPLRQLFEIYSEIGVKKLSEMVTSGVASCIRNHGREDPVLKSKLIVAGLLKILLGFLAGPRIRLSLRERHDIILAVQNLRVCGFDELVMVDHKLVFPSSKEYVAKGRRVVFFDQAAQTIFVHRGTFEKRHTSIEFITYIARAISSMLPLDTASLHNDICRLIQTGIVFRFEEDEVKFILQTENLHVFREDEEFLATLFSPQQQVSTPPLRKSRRTALSPLPTPPGFSHKKLSFGIGFIKYSDSLGSEDEQMGKIGSKLTCTRNEKIKYNYCF